MTNEKKQPLNFNPAKPDGPPSALPDDGETLPCTCPMGAVDPDCLEHQRLARLEESDPP